MRLKSNAVWHSLPGVEAVYQPIGAPDPLAARLNVGLWQRMVGKYDAVPGVLPTWSAVTGWTFNGSSQYLNTGIVIQTPSCSAIICYSGFAGGLANTLFGAYGTSTFLVQSSGVNMRVFNGGFIDNAPFLTAGVYGISGKVAYRNGLPEANGIPGGASGGDRSVMLGALNLFGSPSQYAAFKLRAILLSSRILTASEMWLASRQMAYCEQNPDWNAWARRRQYFYASSAAAGRVGIYGRRGAVALPGGVSIRSTDNG